MTGEFDEFYARMDLENDCHGIIMLSLLASYAHMLFQASGEGWPVEMVVTVCACYLWLLADAGQYRVVVGDKRVRVEER